MYKCVFCGLENPSEKARFCVECGPEGPASDWTTDEIDQSYKVEQYASILSDFYFEAHSNDEVESFSLRIRERLKISHDTHIRVLAEFAKQKRAVAHLSNFKFEFNQNVTDAYAGHDTFLNFRYTNLSDVDLFKVNLLWDDPDTEDRVDLRAETKSFIKPRSSITIGGSVIFDRIGIKEISDLLITISDQFGDKAVFRSESFRFKVSNHDQRLTQNISTHNQISIEGRGVVDASGMGTERHVVHAKDDAEPRWQELTFSYIPQAERELKVESIGRLPDPNENYAPVDSNSNPSYNKSDLLSILKAAEQGDSDAQNTLGDMYADGEGVAQNDELAAQWYRKAAEQGNVRAQENIGDMYEAGLGVAQNDEAAVQWYRKAAEQGDAGGQRSLGLMYYQGKGVAQNYEQAFNLFMKASDQGDADAQHALGQIYLEGQGVSSNADKSVFWFLKAAEQGHLYSQHELGKSFHLGRGVEQNYEQALQWYLKAAAQGYPNSQNNIGMLYQDGLGVPEDYEKAAYYYQLAAEQGLAYSQNNLALLYESGNGVVQNNELAFQWFSRAADQGNAAAQDSLATMYINGVGVNQNDDLALHWYKKAAEQLHANAEFNIGWMYASGRGVANNDETAVAWYRRAADQGHLIAKHNLGCMYLNGQGVAQNDLKAEQLFREAAEEGYPNSQHNLGWMYQEGRGVDQSNELAIEWYKKAADQGYEGSIEALENFNADGDEDEDEVLLDSPPIDGEGTWEYDGYSYSGSYRNGLFHGWGEITWHGDNFGHKYVGNFVDGVRQGQGTYTFPNGERQVGQFENNEFVTQKKSNSDGEFNSIDDIISYYARKKIAALGVNFFIQNGPKFDKKIQNFSQSFSKVHHKSFDPEKDTPILFYDGTILGSGKDGIVFTANSIYAKGCLGRSVEHIDIAYSQIESVRMTTEKIRDKEIFIESSGHLELISLNPIYATPEDLLIVVEMLSKIRKFLKN